VKFLRIPPEYKDKFHIKEEDLERINEHIIAYEQEFKRKKKSRVWIWVIALILGASLIFFGLVDISGIKRFLGVTKYSIKERISIGENVVDLRFSKPLKNKIQVIIEPIKLNGRLSLDLISIPSTNTIKLENTKIQTLLLDSTKEITISVSNTFKKVSLDELQELK